MKKLSIIIALAMLLGTLCIPAAADDVVNPYADADLYINFEDGFVDVTGNHTVTAHNGAEIVDSVYGNGVNVNVEDNSYVTIENMEFGRSSFTVSFWLRINDTGAVGADGDPMVIGNKDYTSGGNPGWAITFRSNTIKMNFKPTGTGSTRQDVNAAFDTAGNLEDYWNHFAITIDVENGTREIYINGVKISGADLKPNNKITVPEDGTLDTDAKLLVLGETIMGNYNPSNDEYLDLDFDDVAVFKYAMTVDQIQALYNYESASNEPPETDAPDTDEPETDAPETDEPNTDAPETDAPETDAPNTDGGETDGGEDAGDDEVPTGALVAVFVGAGVSIGVAIGLIIKKNKEGNE